MDGGEGVLLCQGRLALSCQLQAAKVLVQAERRRTALSVTLVSPAGTSGSSRPSVYPSGVSASSRKMRVRASALECRSSHGG
jgi:hypothetical protein